ncbi:MAG TPA: glycosyltransferase family 39 protein [Bdellovibrionota bacterium]|jgi:4-amino-4-deoxy-L-arabinose transferase-like glycosyltransferase|nr:glycosyltransferase family 39 protein [Bdellovibrionota bacterium]
MRLRWWVLLATAVILLARLPSLAPLVLDHDESTYMVMAREWLQGAVLYVDVWDTKPPGIFLVTAFAQTLFGTTVVAFRLFSWSFVALGAWAIFAILRRRLGESPERAAFWALLYPALLTTTAMGHAANSELFFSAFTLWGLYWFCEERAMPRFVAGLCYGVAIVIKLFAAFDVLPLPLFMLLRLAHRRGEGLRREILQGLGFVLGLVLPALTLWWFASTSSSGRASIAAYHYVFWELPAKYVTSPSWGDFLKFLERGLLVPFWAVLIPALIVVAGARRSATRTFVSFASLWLIVLLAAQIKVGKFFPHYGIQFLPVVLLLASQWRPTLRISTTRIAAVALVVVMAFGLSFARRYLARPDGVRTLAQSLRPHIAPRTLLLLASEELPQILYLELDARPAIPYVHRTLLTQHRAVLPQTVDEIWNEALAKGPDHVLARGSGSAKLRAALIDRYREEDFRVGKDRYTLWTRKP